MQFQKVQTRQHCIKKNQNRKEKSMCFLHTSLVLHFTGKIFRIQIPCYMYKWDGVMSFLFRHLARLGRNCLESIVLHKTINIERDDVSSVLQFYAFSLEFLSK